MNLFDNIIQSSVGNFLGTKPNVPSTPSFTTPQAPRTLSYTQPTVTPKPKISQGVRNGGFAPGYEDTVDETQSPVFKAVQGAANLFTGVQKRLGETVQSDIDRRQQQEDKEGMEFAQYLADQGYNEEQIMSGLDSLKSEGKLTVSDNFIQSFNERLVGGIANRMGEVQRTTERLSNEPLTTRMTTGIPSYAGDVVGTAFEPVAAALSPVVQKVIEKTGQTQNIEEVGKWWEGVRQSNPNFADALEGVLNVSQLAPLSPKVTAPIKSGIKTIGTKTLQTAEKIAPNLTNQAKKLTSQAEMGFRKQAEDIAVPKLSEMGMREKQKVTGNVIETKPGLFKKEELVRSPQEALAIEEVSRMLKEGKIKKGGTELQKSTAISDEITGLAEALKGRLDNTPNPVSIPKQEVEYFINDLAANIKKNPIMVGDMQESAYKIIQNLKDKLTKDTYTPSDLLEIRKQLDSDVQAFKGETVFDPKIENAFSSTLKEFRQGINNKVAELVPDAQVRSFLDRQSALYTAKDNVDLKWSKQANTTIGRILSKIQSATGIPRTEIIELTTGLGLLGASSLAPVVAPIAIGAAVIAGGKKAIGSILSPKNKIKLANMITKIDEAIKKNPKDAELLKAKELFSNPTKNGGITTNIRSSSNNGSSNSQPVKPIVKPNTIKNESVVPKNTVNTPIVKKIASNNQKNGTTTTTDRGNTTISDKPTSVQNIGNTKEIDISSVLKEYNEKSKYFRDSGATVKALKLEGNIDDIVRNGNKLKEGWSYVEQKKLGKTEKTQGWYVQEPLNPIGGGKTITAIRADGVGIRVKLPDGYKNIEGTVARDFVENVIDRNPFIDTEIKGVVTKQLTHQSNAKQQGITPRSTTTNIGDRVLNSKESTLSYIESEFKKTLKSNLVKSKEDFIREAGKDFSLSRRDDTLLYRAIKKYKELGGEDFNLGDLYEKIKTIKKPIVKPNTIKNESVVPKNTVNTPIVKKTMDNDEYFYHGTDPYGFSKIKEEGIIPQKRGVSSLSKTEEYSRNFAFPEATGTKGEMLRVKKDFMKGKLFNTRKQRPKSDEMYEVLTKQTIPPEAIEVLKDGKWKPLITPKSNAKQQGIKPKSSDTIPEGYIENAFGEIQKNPSNKKVSPKAPIDKPMIQLLDEKTPGYIKNSLELAQSPTTMGRYISEILGKDIKNVSVKDISEFYKKYGPFPKWEKRLQDGVTGYEKGRMPGMSENGYKQDKLLLKAFYGK